MNRISYENQVANFLPVIREGSCPRCGGMGYLSKDLCHFCYGTGVAGGLEWNAELTGPDDEVA